MFILIFSFIVLPVIILDRENMQPQTPNNATGESNESVSEFILDLIQGTGQINNTILFYGKYTNKTLIDQYGIEYNLPLSYILVMACLFILSLIAIVKSAARGFKERLVEGEGQFYHYCNLVFGGWDFCIHNEKSAKIKHKALYNEIKACLESKRLEEERKSRSKKEKIKLIILRTIINIFVLSILGSTVASIVVVFDQSVQLLKDETNKSKYIILILQFLPSLCITALNVVVPVIFKYLIEFERYSPMFVLRLTLLRTIILKLLSLGVLVYKLFAEITGCKNNCDSVFDNCKNISENSAACVCWETYVGQQIYKLVITDFATHVVLTFFLNFPRSLIAKRFENKFAKLIGEQQYDLPKNVLDVVYSQTLCWLGVFFSPLLPAIVAVMNFFMFYIKKFVCLINSTPSSNVYRASRSNSMFMFVLLIAHCLAVIPVALAIAELTPSETCGPFRGMSEPMWSYVVIQLQKLPTDLINIVFLIGTAWFSIPVFIILVLCLYYYSAIIDANKHMVEVLKNQLVLEGHDKQFLLNRLVEFSKQQQEYQKRLRNAEMLRERDRVTASN